MQEMKDFTKIFQEGPHYHLEKNPDWQKFNIIGGHFAFGIHAVLKADQFRYLGVFREPVAHYLSMYKAFLRVPEKYRNKILPGSEQSIENMMKLKVTHNMQTWFLTGISPEEIIADKEKAYQIAIENCEKYFDGIYPTERFDEGLFFFRNKIGLKPQYYLKKNVAKNAVSEIITSELKEKIKKINEVDIRLFIYLNERFTRDFNAIPGIMNEVRIFKFFNWIYGVKNKIINNSDS